MTYNKNDPETIRSLFNSIATSYDKTNAVLSLQMHKSWNKALVHNVLKSNSPKVFLDLCCGTCAIGFEYLKKISTPTKAYMLDFSEGMLEYAKIQSKKLSLKHHDIHFLKADAQEIPLLNSSVDCVTIAYGIRNVKDPKKCIQEVHRVLSPGGTFGILELTRPKNPLLRLGHSFYLRTLLPVLGKILTSNQEAYQYLCKSIPNFIPPETLEQIMSETGFRHIQKKSLLGGVATLLIGKKAP